VEYASNGTHSPDSRWVGGSYEQMMEVVEAQGRAFERIGSVSEGLERFGLKPSAHGIRDGVYGTITNDGFIPANMGSPGLQFVPGGIVARGAAALLRTRIGTSLFGKGTWLNTGSWRIGLSQASGRALNLGKGRYEVFSIRTGSGPGTRHWVDIPLRRIGQ
jgi:hypothetical protein